METKRPISLGAEDVMHSYFPVLDYGFVALKDYMGNDDSIEQAARVSYGEDTRHVSTQTILERYLLRHWHMTPFEMPVAEFHIGMPIFVMRQWVRHRMASMNEYSGRYSVMPMLFYTPDRTQVCSQSKKNKQGRGEPVSDSIYGDFLLKLQTARGAVARNYREWVDETDIARETARLDLPLSTYTYCYWKSDLRNLFNLMRLRSDSHAQWEIQQFADIVCGIVKRWCPIAFDAFQDYQQLSVTFSQKELPVLPLAFVPSPNRELIANLLINNGLTKREVGEFWDKLEPKVKRDYSLDMATAKSGEYFMNIAANSAVEVPSAA